MGVLDHELVDLGLTEVAGGNADFGVNARAAHNADIGIDMAQGVGRQFADQGRLRKMNLAPWQDNGRTWVHFLFAHAQVVGDNGDRRLLDVVHNVHGGGGGVHINGHFFFYISSGFFSDGLFDLFDMGVLGVAFEKGHVIENGITMVAFDNAHLSQQV